MNSNPYCPPEQNNAEPHFQTRMQSLRTRLTQRYGMLTAASYTSLVLAVLALYIALMSGYSGTLPGGYVMPYSEPLRYSLNLSALGLMCLAAVSSICVCRFGTIWWRLAALPTAIASSLFLLILAFNLLKIWAISLLNWAISTLF